MGGGEDKGRDGRARCVKVAWGSWGIEGGSKESGICQFVKSMLLGRSGGRGVGGEEEGAQMVNGHIILLKSCRIFWKLLANREKAGVHYMGQRN